MQKSSFHLSSIAFATFLPMLTWLWRSCSVRRYEASLAEAAKQASLAPTPNGLHSTAKRSKLSTAAVVFPKAEEDGDPTAVGAASHPGALDSRSSSASLVVPEPQSSSLVLPPAVVDRTQLSDSRLASPVLSVPGEMRPTEEVVVADSTLNSPMPSTGTVAVEDSAPEEDGAEDAVGEMDIVMGFS